MSMQDLHQAFEIIDKYKACFDFDGIKDKALIDNAEKYLGLNFPPTYQKFLEKYGCGGSTHIEIYGIINENFLNSTVPDAVWLTTEERKTNFPHDLIIVGDSGYGPYYVLDCSRTNHESECPVILWDGDDKYRNKMEVLGEDFGAFLLQELQNMDEIKAQERSL